MKAVIYKDGNGTKVTTHEFIANDSIYLIRGIIDARIHRLKISAAPALFCIAFGLVAAVLGSFNLLSNDVANSVYFSSIMMTPNLVAGVLGFMFLLSGIIGLLARHNHYAVHIVTAEGERDTIISTREDNAERIVSAIKSAVKESTRDMCAAL